MRETVPTVQVWNLLGNRWHFITKEEAMKIKVLQAFIPLVDPETGFLASGRTLPVGRVLFEKPPTAETSELSLDI